MTANRSSISLKSGQVRSGQVRSGQVRSGQGNQPGGWWVVAWVRGGIAWVRGGIGVMYVNPFGGEYCKASY